MKNITVYLGSSGHAAQIYQDTATATGSLIGSTGRHLIYGGMDAGLMGRVARQTLATGGTVSGIIPRRLKDSERILAGMSETLVVEDLWDRKKRLFLRGDVIVTLPGGFGTIDEMLEVLFWRHLGLHDKAVVLVNPDHYWDDLHLYLNNAPDFDPSYVHVVEHIDEVGDLLGDLPAPKIEPPAHLPHFEDEITRTTHQPIVVDIPSVENAYYLACALGLKQLGRHNRPIGILNEGGGFDALLRWVERAENETFITKKCQDLFAVAGNEEALRDKLKTLGTVEIDLHTEKWGPREGGD